MFESHKLNELGQKRVEEIRKAFGELLRGLTGLNGYNQQPGVLAGVDRNAPCPHSRELSITKTKLEEACMWAIKSVATNPENCE